MPGGKKGSYIDFLNPSRPDPGRREKINLNIFFYISLWSLKRFCDGLKGLLFQFYFIQLSEM